MIHQIYQRLILKSSNQDRKWLEKCCYTASFNILDLTDYPYATEQCSYLCIQAFEKS